MDARRKAGDIHQTWACLAAKPPWAVVPWSSYIYREVFPEIDKRVGCAPKLNGTVSRRRGSTSSWLLWVVSSAPADRSSAAVS